MRKRLKGTVLQQYSVSEFWRQECSITVIIEELCNQYLTCICHLYITEFFGKPAFQEPV